MNKKRPINLDLSSLKFPPMAIVSILHRISGVILFILLPLIIFVLGQSLQSEEMFKETQLKLTAPIYKFILWAFYTALIYHIIAGIRHMIMDFGFGETLHAAKKSAIIVIFLAVCAAIFLGFWLC